MYFIYLFIYNFSLTIFYFLLQYWNYWILYILYAGVWNYWDRINLSYIFYKKHMQEINNAKPCPSLLKVTYLALYFLPQYWYISSHQSHLQDPFLQGMKKVGDEKFQAQLYQEAEAIYTFVLKYPTFRDTFFITEKLLRKRALCFYKMVSSFFY